MRKITSIEINNKILFKDKLLIWAQKFENVVWLDSNTDSNNGKSAYSNYDTIIAVDAEDKIHENYRKSSFDLLTAFKTRVKDYIFGYLSYDLKNDTENLSSNNFDGLGFSDIHFFQPKKIFFIKGNILEMHFLEKYVDELENDLLEIDKISLSNKIPTGTINLRNRISKKEYFNKLDQILDHIHRGDIYEVNYCQEYYSQGTTIDPVLVYQKLNKISTPPFAAFLKINDKYLLSASPERFVKKQDYQIISQPIKGTAKRSKNIEEDREISKQLYTDPKERSENIMIVDLVRNDLSKTAVKGTVQVEELCKVYSFKQVHQLVSTVKSTVPQNMDSVIILKSLFPMGSMTGAPKISAMKIIEEQEETKRGLYSGAVGYFTPTDDFDFNVVIRSILYNQSKKYVSFSVGGAITAQSNPEKEYQECLLKANAMINALTK